MPSSLCHQIFKHHGIDLTGKEIFQGVGFLPVFVTYLITIYESILINAVKHVNIAQ